MNLKTLRPGRKTFLLATPVLLAMLMYGARVPLLTGIFDFLVIRDDLRPADLIFVLNGDATVRPAMAASVYRKGLAPLVVIARSEDSPAVQMGAQANVTDTNLAALKKLGVPESQTIQLRPPGGVVSTYDEAQALKMYARDHSVKRVIVVSTELHTRRARFIVRTVLGPGVEVQMAPVPDRKYGVNNWWKTEDGIVGCQNEYIKLVFYYFKYS